MDIEEKIKNCEVFLKQIKQYDPDPFYVNHFFEKFIDSINDIFNGIFEEADRDFGLFILKNISEKEFREKAKKKNDKNAIKFLEWYSVKFTQEHTNPYPNMIRKICELKNKFHKLPEIKIMIRAIDRYKEDVNQQIIINLSNDKLRSRDELDVEIKRQLPIFLEIINYKRRKNNEPKVNEDQIVASAFLDIEEHKDVEIAYASEIYIPVIKRLVGESRLKN